MSPILEMTTHRL